MLELKNIVKDYVSANNVTHALKGISVNFRKNEFVSILGASGCGKTTTLNIIGGLDRYTSGDLLINGKSTKDYTDRDWDTYRNHSIGFIFQTYNLIAHQNILKNVELALTISGVSKEERKQRAYEALKKVGLEGMEKKKPNQLSGGQCQRVAIARALINNPEILLADEPTGALDSETSIQIMDLLKEVASDRLVIMVTHNPELAEKYSTRIVRMSDGLIVGDSLPFDGTGEEPIVETVSKGKKKKSSMSLATATGLSLSNLVSKMKRTVLVTIAGSIGIIGVSAVLAVSQGVKDYIGDLQNDMLSSYPIKIEEEAVDYSSLMSGLNASEAKEHFEFDPNNPKIGVDSMISYLMTAYSDITKVKTNTIDDKLLSFIDATPKESVMVTTKDYSIDVTNNIFGRWQNKWNAEDETDDTNNFTSLNGITQSYIAELQTVAGFEKYATYVNFFTNFMHEVPDNIDYINDQYDVIAGDSLSLGENDLVLVVDKNTTLTDLVLAQTGVFEHDEFLNIAIKAIKENDRRKELEDSGKNLSEIDAIIEEEFKGKYPYRKDFKYEDLINREFYYVPQNDLYEYDPSVAPDETSYSITFLQMSPEFKGLGYFQLNGNMLAGAVFDATMKSQQVYLQKTEKIVGTTKEDVLGGTWIGRNATGDTYTLNIDKGNLTNSTIKVNEEEAENIMPSLSQETRSIEGYSYQHEYTDAVPSSAQKMKISAILRLKDSKNFGCLQRGLYYSKAFTDKFIQDSQDASLTNALKAHLQDKETYNTQFKKAFVKFDFYNHEKVEGTEVDKGRQPGYAFSINSDMSGVLAGLFSSFTGGMNFYETNGNYLRSVAGLKTIEVDNTTTGEFETSEFHLYPKGLSIYPKSFEDKDVITDHLDRWNSTETFDVVINGSTKTLHPWDRESLTYTDTIELIVTVINTLIEAITVALVAFTSLSLVVSCFMIAVITYISVVERIKEIGVIRSLGGRKGDVASLFVMETLLTGLFSGVFGIGITYIFQIIFNIILKSAFGIVIANLTPVTAIIMILVSVTLSVVSGLIPSQSAAHKDPVVALRTGE